MLIRYRIQRILTLLPLLGMVCWGDPALCRGAGWEEKPMVIVVDPGHGGDAFGAVNEDYGIREKDVNLQLSLLLKEELEQYENVEVFLTRESDRDISLESRSACAVDRDADLMVSLHNNAAGGICEYLNGCTVLTSMRQYRPEIGQEEQELACCLLDELSSLGIADRGILLRLSRNGTTYPNGEEADYYGLVRRGVLAEIPTVIVEHAFLDSNPDYENYLRTEEQRREVARADARGIARYYGLTRKDGGEVLPPPENFEVRQVQVIDDDYHHDIITYETFFPGDDPGSGVGQTGEVGSTVPAGEAEDGSTHEAAEVIETEEPELPEAAVSEGETEAAAADSIDRGEDDNAAVVTEAAAEEETGEEPDPARRQLWSRITLILIGIAGCLLAILILLWIKRRWGREDDMSHMW